MKVRRKPAVALQIHHLDDGDETDFVLRHVGRAASVANCAIERPSDETNSILIHCLFDDSNEERMLYGLLGVAEKLIANLTSEDLRNVRSSCLDVTLVVQPGTWISHFKPSLLSACGEKLIPIRVVQLNVEVG